MQNKFTHIPEGTKVVVRGRDSGVVYGRYVAASPGVVVVTLAQQLWEWQAAIGISLIDLAQHGVDPSGCKFSNKSGDMTILDACAIITVSDKAAESIEAVKPARSP